MVDVDFGDSS